MDKIDKELSEFVKGKVVIDAKMFDSDEIMKIYFNDKSELIIISGTTMEGDSALTWIMSEVVQKRTG